MRLRRVLVRFWRVSVQIPVEVPEGSGADTVLKFRRVPVQIPVEVPVGSSADSW